MKKRDIGLISTLVIAFAAVGSYSLAGKMVDSAAENRANEAGISNVEITGDSSKFCDDAFVSYGRSFTGIDTATNKPVEGEVCKPNLLSKTTVYKTNP